MTKDTTEVAAFLARIEKLPGEWKHEKAEEVLGYIFGSGTWDSYRIALDLHIGHMAQVLVNRGFSLDRSTDGLACVHNTPGYRLWCKQLFADAIISAAEAIVGEGK